MMPPLKVALPITSLSGSSYGRALNIVALMVLNIAVFAPIPTASVRITTMVNQGLFLICLSAKRESEKKVWNISTVLPLRLACFLGFICLLYDCRTQLVVESRQLIASGENEDCTDRAITIRRCRTLSSFLRTHPYRRPATGSDHVHQLSSEAIPSALRQKSRLQ